jgi:hypothetical protein
VIVVFDGPSDETVGVLQSLKTAFALKIIEQEKSGQPRQEMQAPALHQDDFDFS